MILVSVSFYQLFITFDLIWDEGLLYKLESLGIAGNLLKLFQRFLIDRQQRVVPNGQHSKWAPVLAGVFSRINIRSTVFLNIHQCSS